MSCDIHLLTEVMEDWNDEWTSFDYWTYRDSDSELPVPASIYSERDYLMFSVIAGVRRGGNRLVQLIDRRGFPDDASIPVKRLFESWGSDAHSPSWIGLNELNDLIERTDDIFIEMYVDESEYEKYINDANYIPNMYYSAWGDMTHQINFYPNRYLIILRDLFIEHIEDRERRDGIKYPSDHSNYRIVFWFDN